MRTGNVGLLGAEAVGCWAREDVGVLGAEAVGCWARTGDLGRVVGVCSPGMK